MTDVKINVMLTGADSMLGRMVMELAPEFPAFAVHAYTADELNAGDRLAVNDVVASLYPDWVVNCIAYDDIEAGETNREDALKANIHVPQILGEIAQIFNARMLHVSSAYVFDGAADKPYNEEDLTCPENIYGKTKRLGELALQKVLPDAVIVRPGWVYGPYGANILNDQFKDMLNQDHVYAVSDQFGSPAATFNLARCMFNLMDNDARGIYHYADQGVCSSFEMAAALFEELSAMGLKMQAESVTPLAGVYKPTHAKFPDYLALDTAKYLALPGAKAPPWRESLREYLHKYLEIQDGELYTKLS